MATSFDKNKQIAQRIFDVLWNRGELEAAGELFAQPKGVKDYISSFRLAFPDIHHHVEEMVAEGELVVVKWTASGTNYGSLFGIPPTGETVKYRGMTFIRIRDRKIIEHETLWDTVALLEQMKLVPPIRKQDGSRL